MPKCGSLFPDAYATNKSPQINLFAFAFVKTDWKTQLLALLVNFCDNMAILTNMFHAVDVLEQSDTVNHASAD